MEGLATCADQARRARIERGRARVKKTAVWARSGKAGAESLRRWWIHGEQRKFTDEDCIRRNLARNSNVALRQVRADARFAIADGFHSA